MNRSESNLSVFAQNPESLPRLFAWVKTLNPTYQSDILTSPFLGYYLYQQKSDIAQEMVAQLLTMIRALPLESQARQVERARDYWKNDHLVSLQSPPAVLLNQHLITLASRVDSFYQNAARVIKNRQSADIKHYTQSHSHALRFYEACNELSQRDYYDAAAWADVIATAKKDFCADKSMLDLIHNIDVNQRERERPRIAETYQKWVVETVETELPQEVVEELESIPQYDVISTDNLATIKTLSFAQQADFIGLIAARTDILSRWRELVSRDPIAKRDFHLIELAAKCSDSSALTGDALKAAKTLLLRLNLLVAEQASALKASPPNVKLLNKISELWDSSIEEARPLFKPHHKMQSLLNQLARAAQWITRYFSKAPSPTELLDELKQSKPIASTPVISVPARQHQFFKRTPVQWTQIKRLDSLLFDEINQKKAIKDPITREQLCYIDCRRRNPSVGVLALATATNQVSALLRIVPAIRELCDADRQSILGNCNANGIRLLNDTILAAFTPHPEAMRDLCELELERIIASVSNLPSRLATTLRTLKTNLEKDKPDAVLIAQRTLKRETSWSTWLGLSRTATARRDVDRLLQAMLVLEYAVKPNNTPRKI
jgi:hypothetical protein